MKPPLKIITPAIALFAVATAVPASAGTVSKVVQIGDLNLASNAGQATLEKRIDTAVSAVCASPQAFSLRQRMDQQRCMEKARVDARKQVDKAIAAQLRAERLAVALTSDVASN